jgi:hypothetical protein
MGRETGYFTGAGGKLAQPGTQEGNLGAPQPEYAQATHQYHQRQEKQVTPVALHFNAQQGQVRHQGASHEANAQHGAQPGRSRNEQQHGGNAFGYARADAAGIAQAHFFEDVQRFGGGRKLKKQRLHHDQGSKALQGPGEVEEWLFHDEAGVEWVERREAGQRNGYG